MARTVAPGGKISLADYERLRLKGAARVELSARQAHRIVSGEAWRDGWKPVRTEPEFKICPICGTQYERRFANGRLRSPTFWAQKETCSHSCSVRLGWQRGVWKKRDAR